MTGAATRLPIPLGAEMTIVRGPDLRRDEDRAIFQHLALFQTKITTFVQLSAYVKALRNAFLTKERVQSWCQ
jgi:hypothetical protein